MKFIIGGSYQGKTQEACRRYGLRETQFADGRSCAPDELRTCRGVHHFHEYIRRMLKQETAVEELCRWLLENNPRIVIVSDEIGYGIVPVDAFERLWREQTGRVCCEIAAASEEVVRVVAGIGTVIKKEQS